MPNRLTASLLVLTLALAGCVGDDDDSDGGGSQLCSDHDASRNVYFGDIHVHTAYSFDAYVFDIRADPAAAYRFARGDALGLPPLNASGEGTQLVQLDRPLDFAAVTDHSEFIGEVEACTTPGAAGFDSGTCELFRAGGSTGQSVIGVATALQMPERLDEICGPDGDNCLSLAADVWGRTIDAAEEANEPCSFTSFVGYEYTANTFTSTRHRNIIFANERVPFPTSYIEQPTPQGLWTELRVNCLEAGMDCDAIVIPHNSNESNGNMFLIEYPGAATIEEERAQAEFRQRIEPLMEIYQHKGDSECLNGLSGILGEPDELCGFEKRRQPPFDDCGDGTGTGGLNLAGCVSRRDYARGALLAGLQEAERIGVNPLRLGFIAGTDTHNGTPGNVREDAFAGHRGSEDDTAAERLGAGSRRAGPSFSPGGLAAVWAEENSRASIFAALKRREVYATSGPRIVVRFFAGWDLAAHLCDDPDAVENADSAGVPMGALLPEPPSPAEPPAFFVSALRDAGTDSQPGSLLQRIQIVKGWVADGASHQRVFDVAGDAGGHATVDIDTCQTEGPGFSSLCAVWTDPDFDPTQQAFYYARVLENPSCRWNTFACNGLPPGDRPATCDDPDVPKTIQERAWTSPIWYAP